MRGWVGALALLAVVVAAASIPVSRAAFTAATDTSADLGASTIFSAIRVTTYELQPGAFPGTTHTLALDQELQDDYFVFIRGAAGDDTANGNRMPDSNYARVSGDPHGNFGVVTGAAELRLERRASADDWQGQVTIVEAMRKETTAAFRLLDVVETTMNQGTLTAAGTATTGWSDIGQVGLYGGIRGGGVDSTASNTKHHPAGWARIYPSGSNVVNIERELAGAGSLNGTSRFTTYVVEWGSEWTIQRATVAGSAAGGGVDAAGEYNTAAIASVARDNTFVLAYGNTSLAGLGYGWEGQVFTLGDGVSQNATESTVAVGSEFSSDRAVEVYIHTHPELAVDYRFSADGTSLTQTALSGSITVDPSVAAASYGSTGSMDISRQTRLAVVTNTMDWTGTAYPRAMLWARHVDDTTVQWNRSRTTRHGALWLQSVDFGLVGR